MEALSRKQRMTMNWWAPGSPVGDAYGIIADGSIRAGKTFSMGIAFFEWAMTNHDGRDFILAGKSIGAFQRNVLGWLVPWLKSSGYRVHEVRTPHYILTVSHYGHKNRFFVFSGKDERSQDFVQGMTAAGTFFDEVALMPESFVNQALGRCSVDGAKSWFNCNPGGPAHWFKKNILDKHSTKNLLHLHFTMDDNPSMSNERRQYYESLYEKNSVFYKRYILGLWVQAEGAIYDMWSDHLLYKQRKRTLNDPVHWIAIDYGTQNATVFLHCIDDGETAWVEREYYYSGRSSGKQKTDSEYANDLVEFMAGYFKDRENPLQSYQGVIIDPSAASFKEEVRRRGLRVRDADNDVLDGIRDVASCFANGLVRVNEGCKHLIEEVQGYVWDSKAADRGVEQPLKQNDHCMDALRYFVRTNLKHQLKVRMMQRRGAA